MRPAIRPLALSFAPSLLLAAAGLLLVYRNAQAQTAWRCESDGQTVYSDKPCAAPASTKGELPAKDSAAQRDASAKALDKLERDNAAIDKRLHDRAAREAKERAAAAKAAAKAKPDTKPDPKAEATIAIAKGGKARGAAKKPAGKKRAGKSSKRAA